MEQFKGQARLPKLAVPKSYDIKLKPDLTACKFGGTVAIGLDIVADSRFIVLNAAKLSVNAGSVSFTQRDSSKVFKPSKVEISEEDGILVMEFEETLPLGLGVLAIGFEGILDDNMKGFYRSTYEHNGEKKNMAVTQFEPVDARRCFPCWDEPACKATFKITLEDVPSELVALSNMPVVEEKVNGHLKTVSYLESPIMSTYLVAIVVGLFDYVEDHTSDGVKVRVYCQVGKENQGKFALHVAVKTLELYKEYFAVPYSLPKLDMVAIPDFSAGAMENYGLVTYRESALLFDDQHSSASSKQNVTITVAHELAHQWFGNLVTMEWWTHLWLNEGFATWVSYLATESLFPEWKIWTQFLDESTDGLRLDGLEESHSIEVEINHAGEVDEIFDAISYTKGASVIRMLQNYLGAECFQRSLASYIKKHAYSNTKTEDLWASLEEGSGEPVNKLMNSWTQQKGYPVVSVKVIDQKLEFDQTQFLSSGSQGDGQWIVPITLCCGSYDVRKNFLLNTKSETIDIKEFLGCSIAETESASICNKNKTLCSWIKINVDQAGFYRVKYDEKLAATLRNAIQNKHLSATDRFGILDDSYALSMARQLSFASLLTLLAAYREELDYTVLSNLISISRKLARIAADAVPDLLDLINQFFIDLLQYSAEKLGWQPKAGESHLDAMLRGEILTTLTLFGHDLTINEASRRFHAFLDDRNTPLLPPDIRKTQFLSSGSQGDGQWIVPITLCCGSYDVRKNFLLNTKSETIDIKEFLGCSIAETESASICNKNKTLCSWIKINVDQAGFYRVKYDEKLAATLRNAIQNKHLSATDRFGILDDSYALSMARQLSFASLLTLLAAYREELDYTVLSNLISISRKLARIAADAVPDLLDLINQFFIDLLQYSAEKLGWQPKAGESHLDAMLRGEILTTLTLFGHDLTINEASRRFHAFLDDRNTPLLPPDIRKSAYMAVMQRVTQSNRAGYDSLLRVYRESDQSEEKNRILGSLASCPDPDIILEVLNFLLTSEVRNQDVIFGLAVSSEGRETAWTWLKDNWEQISKTWGSGFLITHFVRAIVSPLASFEKVEEVEEFFKAHPNPAITRTLKQSIERVQINAKWVQSVQGEKALADVLKELTY